MQRIEYNGWTNYETWRINLEAVDGRTLEDFGFELHEVDTDGPDGAETVAEAVEASVNEMIESEASGFALDLAQSFLAEVDWVEIAEHLIADAR